MHRTKGVAEKVEGLASGVAHTGLGLIYHEPDAGHPPPSRLEDRCRIVPTEDHEVISVRDQHRTIPTVQTVFAKRLDEPMHVDVRQQWRTHSPNAKGNFDCPRGCRKNPASYSRLLA